MWVKCVLVWYSQQLTSIFGLVNSSIKKMRLECLLHPSHSMGWCIYKEAQILPQCSAIILSDLKLLFIILLPISRIDKRIFYTKTSSTQSSPMFIRSELSLTLNIEEIRSCLIFFFKIQMLPLHKRNDWMGRCWLRLFSRQINNSRYPL